ncbi:MAG TPA: 2'-5' RNA ligase family protein [Planctomycetota bacterium]|jgi:poly(A) polymerase|nr:2'-5' RNA ligase family protein [Planctomycetota bacterium]
MKTHRSALVVVPPEDLWGPIQAIRRIHDRHLDRWMPHVTLLYPFRPEDEFDDAARLVGEVCAGILPFAVRLTRFRWFLHGPSSATVWLGPEPTGSLVALERALEARFPDCDEVRRHPDGFTPHLSVGQAREEAEAERLARGFQATWEPISFEVVEVALIACEDEGPFRIVRVVPLGGAAAGPRPC